MRGRPTDEFPLPVGDERRDVATVAGELEVDAGAIVRPRAELERTMLVVEGEPGNVDLTRAVEHPRRNPETVAV